MFQYTKEIIINALSSELDGAKVVAVPERNTLIIKRGGEYRKANILDHKIFKTPGYAGVRSVATIECSGLIAQDGAGMYEIGLYQLGIYLKMPNKYLGEYANANWQQFGRPVLVGFEVSKEEATSGALLAEKLAKQLKIAMQADTKLADIEVSGSKVIITLCDPYMHFNVFKMEKYDPTVCDSCLGEYNERNIDSKVSVVDGREPFATGGWIQENLRFPSYPNMRYAALNEDEYPIPGALYTEYAFTYVSPRPGLGGLSGVGQKMEAVTRHIYYVKNELVSEFEAKLTEAFGDSMLVLYNSVNIAVADGVVSAQPNATLAYTPYIYPALAEYELEAVLSDDAPASVSVTANNVVNLTVDADAATGTTFDMTVSVKGNALYAPAVVSFVVA